jgi:hypothetical protein
VREPTGLGERAQDYVEGLPLCARDDPRPGTLSCSQHQSLPRRIWPRIVLLAGGNKIERSNACAS